jgi:hypothetical protein
MVTASYINRLSRAIDQIENRSQPRPWKVVTVPRRYDEDPDAALDRHYAVHLAGFTIQSTASNVVTSGSC